MKHAAIDANRVAEKLWVGSYPQVPETCGYFDVVVLCAEELQTVPFTGCHLVKAPMDDARPTAQEIKTALSAARTVNEMRRRGKRVLVTCAQGINRSAFVAALALMLAGDSAQSAIDRIRLNRRHHLGITPLTNQHFVAFLHSYGVRPGLGQYRPISAL